MAGIAIALAAGMGLFFGIIIGSLFINQPTKIFTVNGNYPLTLEEKERIESEYKKHLANENN